MKAMQRLNSLLDGIKDEQMMENKSLQLVNKNLMRTQTKHNQPDVIRSQNKSNKKGNTLTGNIFENSLFKDTHKRSFITQNMKLNESPKAKPASISKKYINSKNKKLISPSLLSLLKQLFEAKCKNLNINSYSYDDQQSKRRIDRFQQFFQVFIEYNKEYLAEEDNIKTQHLSQTKEACLQLQQLNLVNCEQKISELIVFTKVKTLNLSRTVINPSLVILQNVTHLYLNNCNLRNDSLQKLFSDLINYKVIQLLSLSSPEIGNKNHLSRYEKLYELIRKSDSLSQLQLAHCSLSKENKFFQHLQRSSVKSIDLSYNDKVIGISSNLQYLNLEANNIQNPESLFSNECKSKNELRYLNISSNPIHHYDFKLFLKPSYLIKLSHLKMNNIVIGEECPSLQQFLSYSNSLVSLSLKNCQLGEDSWMNVVFGLKSNYSLQQINFNKNSVPNQDVAKALGEVFVNSSLRKIHLSLCSIRDQYGPLIFANLQQNRHLQSMDVSNNKLSSKSGMTLSQILKNNRTIMELNVEGNCISYLIAKELKECIARNKYLQTKNLSQEYSSLVGIIGIQKGKIQELTRLQEELYWAKRDKLMLEEKKYRIECDQVEKRILSLKQQIRQSLSQQNRLINQIQEIYTHVDSESLTQSVDYIE